MPEPQTLLTGVVFGESPRWHDDRLWFADWGAQQVVAVDPEGNSQVMVQVDFPSFPMCIDWLPDGRLLVVSGRDGLLLRREPDSSLVTHADLTGLAQKGRPWNEIVVDGCGNAYINNQGFEFPGGEFAPEPSPCSPPRGIGSQVADGIAFPNEGVRDARCARDVYGDQTIGKVSKAALEVWSRLSYSPGGC
jgi:sugar lactone lactonase YvrE